MVYYMPIQAHSDASGHYFQWGQHGAKYRFVKGNKRSMMAALNKTRKQAAAAHANGFVE
jgi:hypothetical protein